MKIRKVILISFLAILLLPLTSGGVFAEIDLGDYALSGDVDLGGRLFIDRPDRLQRGYFEIYRPYPEGFLLDQADLRLRNKDGSEYYEFTMSHPGERDQNFLLRGGRIGLYKFEIEYDQLQHFYSTVDRLTDEIRTQWQTLRLSTSYTPKPEIDISAEYIFNKQFGDMPKGAGGFPLPAFSYTPFLEPVDSTQHTLNVGAEYAQKMYQFQLSYNLSLFENDIDSFLVSPTVLGNSLIALPPNNMAQYVTGTGGVNLPYRTRINGSFTYGWLTQDDSVIPNSTVKGNSDLSATTLQGAFSAVSHPCDPLAVRAAYRIYDFHDDNKNDLLLTAFAGETSLLHQMHYSFTRQTVSTGATWNFNSKTSVDFDYRFDEMDREFSNGATTEHTPKVGVKVYPYDWLDFLASYAHSTRNGSDFLSLSPTSVPATSVLTNKFYASDRDRDVVNFIAEVLPVNNVTFSTNFSLYDDTYGNSPFGLLSDNGWSAGADVTWTPYKCLSLTFGYLHEAFNTHERADPLLSQVDIDPGPLLITGDSFDTFTAGANVVIVPEKLSMSSRASYSFCNSDFHNPLILNLNESILHLDTFFKYRYTKCVAFKVGYIFEKFNMTKQYETISPVPPLQNDLEGFYSDYTAHVFVGLVKYSF